MSHYRDAVTLASPPASADPEATGAGLGLKLTLVLALLTAASPVATDLYLASFPEMVTGLRTDAAHVQLTLTAYLIGVGVGPLLWGPLSDRIGRRRPLLIGSLTALTAGIVAAAAPGVEVLVGARFVQAVAASAGFVIARAVVADLTLGYARARVMSLLMMISSLAPVLAPLVGGLLAGRMPWRGVLTVVVAVAAVQAIAALTMVPESLPPSRRVSRLGYGLLLERLRRPGFMAYVVAQSFSFAVTMTYVSNSSFVYQHVLGWSSEAYGVSFAISALGLTLASYVSSRLARRRVHPARIVRRAQPALLVATSAVLLATLSPMPVLLVVPLGLVPICVSFIGNASSALAMEHTADAAGAGSAVLGATMFLTAGVISPIGGIAGDDTAVPMALVMVVSAALSIVCFAYARRYAARHPHTEAAFSLAA